MKTKTSFLIIIGLLILNLFSYAKDSLYVKVLDCGQALCCLIRCPDGKIIIYDAGDYKKESRDEVQDEIPKFLGNKTTVDLLILSHTDADHIGSAAWLVKEYNIQKAIHTGYHKGLAGDENGPTQSYLNFVHACENENVNVININNRTSKFFDTTMNFGGAIVDILCGFGKPKSSWDLTEKSKKINSVSIVMKVEYSNKSVIFCGDAVGKPSNSDDAEPIATEKYLYDNKKSKLKSNVIIAPHHGADNASSKKFIQTVNPEYVIFSAGSDKTYQHPRKRTVERYSNYCQISIDKIFRTDKGEGNPDCDNEEEWDGFAEGGNCTDPVGDDAIDIKIYNDGQLKVNYENSNPEILAQSTQCKGITKKGTQCKNKTTDQSGYCWWHRK
ncbi:MAG: MBL fold metallo-hydrolase [Bacteroidetes bacterium]|nr:MAG: MBL fold metallo-hydrolase [Bacteroidota bacterium]